MYLDGQLLNQDVSLHFQLNPVLHTREANS